MEDTNVEIGNDLHTGCIVYVDVYILLDSIHVRWFFVVCLFVLMTHHIYPHFLCSARTY